MADILDLGSIIPIEEQVKIHGSIYWLRETSGADAVRWREATMRGVKLTNGKVSGYSGLTESEPHLVSLCLFDAEKKPVPIDTIKSWPARIQKTLFQRAKEISQLDEKETKETLIEKMDTLKEQLAAMETGETPEKN